MSSLGCIDTAQVRVSRNGAIIWTSRAGVADAISATWNRIADDISNGSFTVALDDATCCPPPVHAKADKVEFIRNGIVEWAGQIQRVQDNTDNVLFEAYDLLGMYQRRLIHNNHSITGDPILLVSTLRIDGDDILPVPLTWTAFSTGIVADLNVLASDYEYTWDKIKEIAGIGLDITAVGGRVYYGDLTAIPLDQLILTTAMVQGIPTTGEAGEGTATRVIVKGDGGLVGIYPPGAPTADPRYGIEELVIDGSSITSQATLDAYAQAEYEQRVEVPRFVNFSEGAWLNEDYPATLQELIPGRVIKADLRSDCAPVAQDMRLSAVNYTLDQEGEKVKLEIAPVGTAFTSENV